MAEVDGCPWCAGGAFDARSCSCPSDCGVDGCMQNPKMPEIADLEDDNDWERCDHEHDEDCYDYQGFYSCRHSHCFNCGGCNCPGYCDDHQTYNLRPAETGTGDTT